MIKEHEIDLHPKVEELNINNSLINEYIKTYSKIELRNIIILGLKKGYKNFVKLLVTNIPSNFDYDFNYDFDFDVIINVSAKLGYLDIIEYLSNENIIDLLKLKNLILKKSSFHSNPHILEWMINKNILNSNEVLLYNAQIGKIDVIKYFYYKGLDIHFKDDLVMRTSGYFNQLETLKYLCEELNCNIKSHNNSILRVGCERGYTEIVKYAISKGSDVNSNNFEPIKKSCIYGHLDIVKLLIDAGTNYKINNCEPLCKACSNGHLDIVDFILSIDPNYNTNINVNNSEPLKQSIRHNHQDIFNLLIKYGADIITHSNLLIYESINSKTVWALQYFILNHTNILFNNDNSKALVKACESGLTQLVKLLLNNNTDINCFNGLPLIKSIEGSHYELINFLLSNGAKLDPIDNSLVSQTISKSPEIIKLLLDHGLDVNILSKNVLKKLIDKGLIIKNNFTSNLQNTYTENISIDDFNFDEYNYN